MKALGIVVSGVLILSACTVAEPNIAWGDNSSQWANDGDCDDPRFTGPWAHSLLLPEDAFRDANDCRQLYQEGKVSLRPNYQPGVTYENPGYVGPN